MPAPQRTIEVLPYDPLWLGLFEKEAAAIGAVAPECILAIHHIGSTAVPGLAAKPIIDLLLEVSDLQRLDRSDGAMESLGYTVKGEFGIPGRRFYLKGIVNRTHHVHAFRRGSPELVRHLAVRDYLRVHPGEAAEYGALKSRLAAKFRDDNDGYCEAKHEFVSALEQRALSWIRRSDKTSRSKRKAIGADEDGVCSVRPEWG